MQKKSIPVVQGEPLSASDRKLLNEVRRLARKAIKRYMEGELLLCDSSATSEVLNICIVNHRRYVAIGKNGAIAMVSKPCETLEQLMKQQLGVSIDLLEKLKAALTIWMAPVSIDKR